ncbi:uncharacterized protein CLUP02_11290, partial [Colletotrichum lupini]
CTRLNLECGGYATPIKFRDQTDLLKRKHGRKRKEKAQTPAPTEPSPSSNAQDSVEPTLQSHQVSQHVVTPGDETFHSADESHQTFDESQELSHYEAAASLALISGGIHQDSLVPAGGHQTESPSFYTPFDDTTLQADSTLGGLEESNADDGLNTSYQGVATPSSTPVYPRIDSPLLRRRQSEQANRQLTSVPTIPVGLLESAKFAEDMVFYHHFTDTSPYGTLSILSLNDILQAEHLDKAFFHAALALAALDISQARPTEALGSKAALQALDHFVTALGTVRMAQLDDEGVATGCPPNQDNAISWLATLLLLANFELQRGQMKLWYIHSRAAVTFLSQHLNRMQDSPVGESLIRSFSRIAALLDIFDRAYSVRYSIASPDVSDSLSRSLVNSPHSADRLLFILPRVIKLEEEWRSNPQHDLHWREQAESLIEELKAWRKTVPDCDVPPLHEHTANPYNEDAEGPGISIRPLSIPDAPEPVKAATTFMHYLVSLLRLETRYLPGAVRQLPPKAKKIVLLVCRLAAGVPYASCAAVNAYSHGMVAAMMNCYHMSEEQEVKDWVKNWIAGFPREREGIWNVRHAHRVLNYVDQEYTRRGSRYNWEIIKVRLIDLETDATPSEDEETDPDKFSVEIYSRCPIAEDFWLTFLRNDGRRPAGLRSSTGRSITCSSSCSAITAIELKLELEDDVKTERRLSGKYPDSSPFLPLSQDIKMSPSAISTSSATLPKASDLPDNGHPYAELDVTKMLKTLVPEADQLPVPDAHDPVRLGQNCTTAHMVQVPWAMQSGWGTPVMSPYGKIALEPTASVLHYATESFEGMKAYRGHDNKLRLFRPDLNCARLLKSNARVGLPSFNPSALLAIITTYLGTECPRWLPDPGTNLYVRPAMVGSGSALGINQPPEALSFLFAALFPQSLGGGSTNAPHPGIKLLASSPEHIRAWPGGFGSAKVGANYGPAMVSHAAAKAQGCTQTLWLFGEERIVTVGIHVGRSDLLVATRSIGQYRSILRVCRRGRSWAEPAVP